MDEDAPGQPGEEFLGDQQFLKTVQLAMTEMARDLGAGVGVDIAFVAYLRVMARFGYFSFGPITIDVRLVEQLLERTARRIQPPGGFIPSFTDDYVRFSRSLVEEVRRRGNRRIDELHMLLAFMRFGEGLPARVFGELGVTPEQVEAFAHEAPQRARHEPERLYSPEEAAEYLGVHVQTVRAWIRSGRLLASRLAGQRALRIRASDLLSVLEPLTPGDTV